MRILHTSDWHLGRTLYGRKRYEEFTAFLDWLTATIEQEAVDALLVAGDVFDTSAPSHRAQEIYYRFLCRVATSLCRHVVVVAGNHDSPTFLEAPKELLRAMDVHVIGSAAEDPADEVLVLRDPAGTPELIVCAVPYLRDRDIRRVETGEDSADKARKLLDGIRDHYATVTALAEARRAELGANIPLVAMGHLFTAGGQTLEGDGVRELYVGSLVQVSAGIFPDSLDYLALGHLHVPQRVGGAETRRYSGSPLPMGFGEAKQEKSLCLVAWDRDKGDTASTATGIGASAIDTPGASANADKNVATWHGDGVGTTLSSNSDADPGPGKPVGYGRGSAQGPNPDPGLHGNTAKSQRDKPATYVRLIPIPVFQPLEHIQGDWERLAERLQALVAAKSPAWIEVIYEGEAVIDDLRERLEAIIPPPGENASGPEILRVRNNRLIQGVLGGMHDEESLGDLDEQEVFTRCLETHQVPVEQRQELLRAYQEILVTIHHDDPLAE